ncbi:hypothetical protein SESBI_00630 [Sesbania bispinosa]|nr:hypothetical protein SESBI_00630 [Sesbania bispinosa]
MASGKMSLVATTATEASSSLSQPSPSLEQEAWIVAAVVPVSSGRISSLVQGGYSSLLYGSLSHFS